MTLGLLLFEYGLFNGGTHQGASAGEECNVGVLWITLRESNTAIKTNPRSWTTHLNLVEQLMPIVRTNGHDDIIDIEYRNVVVLKSIPVQTIIQFQLFLGPKIVVQLI